MIDHPNWLRPLSFDDLKGDHSELDPPVVDGLFRAGEVCNIIAASKSRKSWMMYGLMFSIAMGRRWLDTFQTVAGRVLIIDNELKTSTIWWRMEKVRKAMGISHKDLAGSVDTYSLRGKGVTLDELDQYLSFINPGDYSVIVLDAWYRFIPQGSNENGNADITALYNMLDQYAAQTGAAFVVVHHASKGSQGDKAVTDVGAGAGAQSRAADTHMVLRAHDEDDCVVLEAALRSFPPVKPVGLRWEFPQWKRYDKLDTTALKDRKTKAERKNEDRFSKDAERIRELLKQEGKVRVRNMREQLGMNGQTLTSRLDKMYSNGWVDYEEITYKGNDTREYWLKA